MNQKRAGIDLDGVLNYYPGCWVDFINQETGSDFKDLDEVKQVLPKEQYDGLKDSYRRSSFKANLKPRQEMIFFLRNLREQGYHITVLTSRPFESYPDLESMTKGWLDKNNVPYDLLVKKNRESLKELFFSFCIDDENNDADLLKNYSDRVFLFNHNLNQIKEQIYLMEINEIVGSFRGVNVHCFWESYVTGNDAPHYHIPYRNHLLTKLPCDMFIYPHMLQVARPDVVVEIGTQRGGSAIFFADIIKEWNGSVVTVDKQSNGLKDNVIKEFVEKNISFIHGDINKKHTVKKIKKICQGKNCFIIDDGSHKADEVYKAFENLNCLIPVGGFYIVEDSFTNAILGKTGCQPHLAIAKILRDYPDFLLYPRYDRYVFSTMFKSILRKKQDGDNLS